MMRSSGWLPAIVAWLFFVIVVLVPASALLWTAASLAPSGVQVRSAGELLARSLFWAAIVAAGAMALGWVPGRLLGRSVGTARFVPAALMIAVPLCLPAYLVFYAWYQSWPADSALFRWAASTDRIQLVREATLLVGLVCWSWPIVSLCVATSSSQEPAAEGEQFRIDGAAYLERFLAALRRDGAALLMGGLLVGLLTMNNTTCFDLAQVFTFGNELRAIEALGANARDSLIVSSPVVAIGLVGALVLWRVLRPSDRAAPLRRPSIGRGTVIAALLILGLCFVLPLALFIGRLAVQANVGSEARRFFDLYGRGVAMTAAVGVATGVLGGVLAIGAAINWMDHRRRVRIAGHVAALGWLLAALAPGILIGVALEAAYNRPSGAFEAVYQSPVIMVIGHLARFGVVAVLLARWLAAAEPRDLVDARRIDGATSLRGLLAAGRARIVPAAAGSMAIVTVLSMSEIPVTSFVAPPARPGSGPIAVKILNDMHYQRPQTVMIAGVAIVLLAFAGAAAIAAVWRIATRMARPVAPAVLLCSCLLMTGCDDEGGDRPLDPRLTFGSPGLSLGQFSYPRACAADPEREFLYVVDKTARVQRFGFDGEPHLEWRMPEWENGKPTGMNVCPENGHVFVADTHYFRVVEYDAEGHEIRRFGEFGTEPGQFIFPTDIEFGPEDRLYVAEYGGNDRIQVFSADGEYLFQFGEIGEGPNQFNRPQSMVFNADNSELFVADSCNHRIVVLDPDGNVLRTFGEPGDAPGQMSYPYDLMLLDDGTLLVCEFGNNRVQRFTIDGESLGVYGRVGRGEGELQYPWAVDGGPDDVFVVDSGNNRVHRIRPP